MTPQADPALDWEGQTMLDRNGDRLGTIEEIYLVEETGRPEWAVVRLSGLGRRRTLVPLTDATQSDDGIRGEYAKGVVKDAPSIGGDAEPSAQQVADVYRHYGIVYELDVETSGDDEAAASRGRGGARDRGRSPSPAGSGRGGGGQQATAGSTLKRTVKEFSDDNLTHWAAALTYYGVLSIFPALLAIVSILGLIGSSAIQPLMDNLTTVAPGPAKEIVTGALKGLQQGGGASVLFVVALAGAIWSASGYISAFMDASNAIYDIEEARPIWKKLSLRIAVTVLMLVLLAASAVAVVLTGPVAEQAGRLFGVGDSAVSVWNVAKWPVLVLIAAFMFAVLYYSAPNVKQPGLTSVLPGGVLAVVLWIVASVAFAVYVASFGSYNKTYGALGGVIVFLVWLWLTNLAILLGAEFNAERARSRHIAAGHPPDEEPYLPPRARP
jgi:membrane protein